MPLYEYYCSSCNTKFDALRPSAQADAPIKCEHCESKRTARVLRALQRALEALGRCHAEAVAQSIWRTHVEAEPRGWFVVGWLAARRPRSLRSAERCLGDLTRAISQRR